MALIKLHHGQFFGEFRREAEAGGFTIAHINADPRRDVQRHTHDAAHFIFVTRGHYLTAARGDGALIYNPPGTTHRDRFRAGRDGRFDGKFLSVSIAPERMTALADGLAFAEAPARFDGAALAARLVAEMERWEPASRLAAEGICLELMALVARRREADVARPRWLALACEMLRERAATSVGGVAGECGVHPVHLARAFRRFVGCSPGAYLRRCRVERAAELLRRGALTLAEVALRSGFADQSHMTRAFRRAHAVTPAQFRKTFHDVARVQDDSD